MILHEMRRIFVILHNIICHMQYFLGFAKQVPVFLRFCIKWVVFFVMLLKMGPYFCDLRDFAKHGPVKFQEWKLLILAKIPRMQIWILAKIPRLKIVNLAKIPRLKIANLAKIPRMKIANLAKIPRPKIANLAKIPRLKIGILAKIPRLKIANLS